jgi:hypothetical protein
MRKSFLDTLKDVRHVSPKGARQRSFRCGEKLNNDIELLCKVAKEAYGSNITVAHMIRAMLSYAVKETMQNVDRTSLMQNVSEPEPIEEDGEDTITAPPTEEDPTEEDTDLEEDYVLSLLGASAVVSKQGWKP